jgi:hypothetical protein
MQLVFAKEHNIIGLLIKWFTKISWVGQCRTIHVIIRYGREESMWLLEANEKGFHPNWWHYFIKKEKIIAQYKIIGIDEDLLEKIIDSQIDKFVYKGYDFGNLFGFIIAILWYKITGKKVKNFFSQRNKFSCSEITYRIFNEVKKQTGIDFLGIHDPELVFPEELLRECENKPNLFKLENNF